jgi:hypothetical protein
MFVSDVEACGLYECNSVAILTTQRCKDAAVILYHTLMSSFSTRETAFHPFIVIEVSGPFDLSILGTSGSQQITGSGHMSGYLFYHHSLLLSGHLLDMEVLISLLLHCVHSSHVIQLWETLIGLKQQDISSAIYSSSSVCNASALTAYQCPPFLVDQSCKLCFEYFFRTKQSLLICVLSDTYPFCRIAPHYDMILQKHDVFIVIKSTLY